MKKFILYLLLFLIVGFGGCTFLFDDNVVEVSSVPSVQILDAKLQGLGYKALPDTFSVFAAKTTLMYDLDISNNDTLNVSVRIDGNYVTSSSLYSDSFEINSALYKKGYHSIVLKIRTNSGTQSLADSFHKELLEFEKKWVFKVPDVKLPTIKLLSLNPENGKLAVKWEPSEMPSEKLLTFNANNRQWEVRITDPKQTQYIDDRFIGGDLLVKLTNLSIYSSDPSPTSELKTQYLLPETIDYTSDGNARLTLKWKKTLFFNNTLSHSISYENKQIWKGVPTDTVAVVDKVLFYGTRSIKFTSTSKKLNSSNDSIKYNVVKNVSIGEILDRPMWNSVHSPLHPEYGFSVETKKVNVLLYEKIVATYSLTSNINSTSQMAISSNGDYLYFLLDYKLMRMSRSGALEQIFDIFTLYGSKLWFSNLTIGADRYISFTTSSSDGSGTVYMYDLEEKKRIFERENDGSTVYQELSIDGNYFVERFYSSARVSRLLKGNVQSTVSLPGFEDVFFDNAKEGKLLLISRTKGIALYDPNTNTGNYELVTGLDYPLLSSYYYDYDIIKGYIGTRIGDNFVVIDPVEKKMLRKFRVSFTTLFRLYNGSLYVDNYKLDLKID